MSNFYPVYPTVGLELTFIPNKPGKWKEFLVKREAIEVAAEFNSKLRRSSILRRVRHAYGLGSRHLFTAKADPFRSFFAQGPTPPHESWCIEINNTPLKFNAMLVEGDCLCPSHRYEDALYELYDTATALQLYPHIEEKRKNGTVIDYPTGGGHLHLSTNFWTRGWEYLYRLNLLEEAWCCDYVNYPLIRWLFAQWSDDINSRAGLSPKRLNKERKRINPAEPNSSIPGIYARYFMDECSAIEARMAHNEKSVYPTYEFRFFDMPRNPKELLHQIHFLGRWTKFHMDKIEERVKIDVSTTNPANQITATSSYFWKLARNQSFAKEQLSSFFTTLGLDAAPYLAIWWERNYQRRMNFGKPFTENFSR